MRSKKWQCHGCARYLIPRPLKNADEIQKKQKNQELDSKTIEKRWWNPPQTKKNKIISRMN